MEHLNEADELKRSAPVLFGLPKTDPFVVPDGFFDRFPHEVQVLVVARTNSRPTWNLWRRMAIALPAIAIIAGGIWWMQRAPLTPTIAQVEVTPLTNAELDNLDDAEMRVLVEESAPAPDASADLGAVDLQLNDDEVLAYLDNEHADLTELITQE